MADKLGLYILSDTHYVSRKMWEEGKPINNREKGDQIALKASPQILNTFFDKIIADASIDNVLITGDLINSGDMQSHLDYIEELNRLKKAGKKVYVTTATHDYVGAGEDENIFHAVYYGKDECRPAERASKKDLGTLYYDFGPSASDSVHDSGSYSLEIQPGYRLLAINDNGNGRSHCGLFEDGFMWLKEEIKKANEKGELIFLAVHHPVLPPWDIYRLLVEFELFGGYEELRKIMCDERVKLVFTGHTHIHGIKKYSDTAGRSFYDITTTALTAAEGKMRRVIFDKDKGTVDISSVGIEYIKDFDTGGLSARDYIYGLNFSGLFEKLMPLAYKDWERFVKEAEGFLNTKKLQKNKALVSFGLKKADNLRMSTLARLAKKYNGLSSGEIKKLKEKYVKDVVFTILAHIFPGNAPYTPETAEYKVLHGLSEKADRILRLVRIDISEKLSGIKSVSEILEPFLYNNRTGDDNGILISLNENPSQKSSG